MKNISKNSFYIETQNELDDLVNLINTAKIIALDTEFTRRRTYYPILSIIQIAVSKRTKLLRRRKIEIYVVDCLSDIDLSAIFSIVSDPKIIKILHSARQDLQIFHHQSNLIPKSIIDTQIMANFCGHNFNAGYSNLVKDIFGKKIDKAQQASDWQRRPLSKKQIEYAKIDVLFLERIYEKFLKKLEKKNRLPWCREEMEDFVGKSLSDSEEAVNKAFSFRGMNKDQIKKTKELILWRENWAKKVDVPRRHLLKDDQINQIILENKTDLKLPKEMLEEMDKILSSECDENDEKLNTKKNFLLNQKQKKCYQEAKKIISKISAKEKLKEQFLVSSFDLKKIICNKSSVKELLSNWRYELFGKDLEKIINKIL